MKVRIKKLVPEAVVPHKAFESDAGFDLVATSRTKDEYGCIVYGTGLAFEIPEGHVGLLFPRSSNAKKDIVLSNSVGVLDSHYRGEVTFKFKAAQRCDNVASGNIYCVGDRIGQMIIMPYPEVEFEEAEELSETDRGTGGYGSSGR